MTPSARGRAANAFGLAGQWVQFVMGAWLAYTEGGYLWSSTYLLAVAAPSVLPLRKNRALGLAAPAGLILLASTSAPNLLVFAACGAAVGVGAAASGRPLAWSSGLTGGPGWAGVTGAAACVFLPSLVGARGSLLFAAGLLTLAVAAGESHDRRGALGPIILPAAMALAVVAGLRVLEPGFGGGLLRAPAVFGSVWALGTHIGWRAASVADPRAILAAPFAAAMTMAGLGVVRGPGLVFLYGFLGACCGLVGGGGHPTEGDRLAASRRFLFVGVAAGALWANAPFDYQTLIWSSAGVVLAGGFATSILSRRLPAPAEVQVLVPVPPEVVDDLFSADLESLPEAAGPPEQVLPEPLDVPVSASVGEDSTRQAVLLLLDATREANAIRGSALEELRVARVVRGAAREESERVIKERLEELTRIRLRMGASTVSEG